MFVFTYLMVSCLQSIRQSLDWGRESIVDFISRCPERVTTRLVFWVVDDFQDCIVRGDSLEGDTTFVNI